MRGSNTIIGCPKCERLFQIVSRCMSFETRRWTDGAMAIWDFSERRKVTKCSGCNQYFWISDARNVSKDFKSQWDKERLTKYPSGSGAQRFADMAPEWPKEWKSAEEIITLSEEEYLDAINSCAFSDTQQELILRIEAWQAGNDRLRLPRESPVYKPHSTPVHSAEAKANLERLAEMLDINDANEKILKAEVKRELGLFDKAVELLNVTFPIQYQTIVDFIRFIAEHHDCVVREIG